MSESIKKITIIKPDDWHVHLRNNQILKKVIHYTGKFYQRALIMPNLDNPITNCHKGIIYRTQIINAMSLKYTFQPLMTCYLTESTIPEELNIGFKQKIFVAAKLYPYDATTNTNMGVKKIHSIDHVFECMQEIGMPLLVHGEEINKNIDIYSREEKFIENTLDLLRNKFPKLKIVLEHITTKEAVEYVKKSDLNYLSATITPHHLMCNRNDMFLKGIRPYFYCLPILKKKNIKKL